MTWLQWYLVVWGGIVVLAAIAMDGKKRTITTYSGTSALINLAIFQWLMWYAGAWN